MSVAGRRLPACLIGSGEMLYKTVTFWVICSGPSQVYFQQSAYVHHNIGFELRTLITVNLDQGKAVGIFLLKFWLALWEPPGLMFHMLLHIEWSSPLWLECIHFLRAFLVGGPLCPLLQFVWGSQWEWCVNQHDVVGYNLFSNGTHCTYAAPVLHTGFFSRLVEVLMQLTLGFALANDHSWTFSSTLLLRVVGTICSRWDQLPSSGW